MASFPNPDTSDGQDVAVSPPLPPAVTERPQSEKEKDDSGSSDDANAGDQGGGAKEKEDESAGDASAAAINEGFTNIQVATSGCQGFSTLFFFNYLKIPLNCNMTCLPCKRLFLRVLLSFFFPSTFVIENLML